MYSKTKTSSITREDGEPLEDFFRRAGQEYENRKQDNDGENDE